MEHPTFLAPAKINLGLRVVGRREDGYHLLRSVMTFAPVWDRLRVAIVPEGITLRCTPAVTGNPTDNLAHRAAIALRQAAGPGPGAELTLLKAIPAAAGLGGGSSDAALVLLVLNQLWGIHWPRERLAALGLTLGADVPFFLQQGTALAEGVGEKLTPLPAFPSLAVVLINPGLPLATRSVFQNLPRTLTPAPPLPTLPPANPDAWSELLHNDLEPVARALAPVVGEMLAVLRRAGAQHAAMTGSGPTVYGVFATVAAAEQVVADVSRAHPGWWFAAGATFSRHPFAHAGQAG